MRQYFKQWRMVSSVSDEALAETIRQDQIDVLIDLSGHTSGNRLLTFARKPAPVQASWLGYLNTTGLTSIDYYLADRALLPAGQFDQQFTEQLVQLPVNAPFVPHPQAPAVNVLPALSNGYITFGCFNRPNKITQATVQQWAAVMQIFSDSRMVLGGMAEAGACAHVQQWFAEAGITADRLSFYARTDMLSYLQQYHLVDICLDTFPSNGVTTTAHALWMGVPTLCVAGDRLASRGAMALMQHLGLNDYIAASPSHYVQQSAQVLSDLQA
ncbi:o-linked n-acetylglucosamine transferase, ogt, putative, partial [Ricinus communis]